ncbi:MAG TPA: DUF115 domain-containing protein [Spirochaetota bacterium]|nr:DUF115 domain-containing protein [Spirochaetota bacterium]
MKTVYKKNIDIITKTDTLLAAQISSAAVECIEVSVSKSGLPVPVAAASDGKPMMVHSRVDPVREAERFSAEADITGKDLVVILGFGFGYHCEAMVAVAGSGVNIIAVDCSPSMARAASENRDLSELFSAGNFFLLLKPDEESLARVLKGRSSKSVIFITHRGSYQLNRQYYENVLTMMKSFISTKDVNIATLARFEKTWCSNIARNIGTVAGAAGANLFFDKFKGMPAIVAAAGPSLTASLEFIKSNMDRCVVVAVDTSYKILADNGIIPHFCMSVDPQLINARYFEGSSATETVLVADPTVHPSVFRFFKGRRAVTGVAFDMMKWIEDISGRKGDLAHGGSVSTNAYDFARRLGASPVIMVGQDLAFTWGLAHAKGSYLDEQIHNKTFRFMNAQMTNRRQLTYLPPVFVAGSRGGLARTTQKMMIFKTWFENRNDPDLINATAAGVLLKGMPNVEHAGLKIPDSAVSPRNIINEVLSSAMNEPLTAVRKKLASRVNDMAREIDELIPVLEKALAQADELSAMIESGKDKSDPGKVGYILSKLEDADTLIESGSRSKGMLSFAMQRVIHTITEGYDTGTGTDNAGARSVFLYSGMLEAAHFNAKLLAKMNIILS